jgi:hemerythrin superfamily protein
MNDDLNDDDIFGPYIAAEAETLRRWKGGKRLRAEDLLMLLLLLSVDIALMDESVKKVTEIAKPITNDHDLWTVLNELQAHIAAVNGRFQRWQTAFLRPDA